MIPEKCMKTNNQAQKNNDSKMKFMFSIMTIIATSVFYLLALSIPGMAMLTGAALFFATLALIFTSVAILLTTFLTIFGLPLSDMGGHLI